MNYAFLSQCGEARNPFSNKPCKIPIYYLLDNSVYDNILCIKNYTYSYYINNTHDLHHVLDCVPAGVRSPVDLF